MFQFSYIDTQYIISIAGKAKQNIGKITLLLLPGSIRQAAYNWGAVQQ